MPATRKTPRKPQPAPEFTRVREFIKRYSTLPTEDDYDIVTTWAIGTWTFSPAAPATPVTYPYLYLTGAKGSGKTVLGRDVFSYVCRNHKPLVGVTGPALFRTIGAYDEETGEVQAHYPTMALDEIDATYSGNKDENLRLVLNDGYKPGSTISRVVGKVTIEYPTYCPKVLIGIDNGNLPDTVTDRSIRIDIRKPEVMPEPLYSFDVEDESQLIKQMLSDWAKANAMVLRDYNPKSIPSLVGRPWEIARSLVQIARALGIEDRIREALDRVMHRNPAKSSGREALYASVFSLFEDHPESDRFTTREILSQLDRDGVQVPGGSGKGLSAVLASDGIKPVYIRLRPDDPRAVVDPKTGNQRLVHRGYMRYSFDDAFVEFLADDDE